MVVETAGGRKTTELKIKLGRAPEVFDDRVWESGRSKMFKHAGHGYPSDKKLDGEL